MPANAFELHEKLFDINATYDSGQPLNFFGDYNNEENSLAYSFKGGRIKIERRNGKLLASYDGDSKDIKEWAKKEVTERFRLYDSLDDIYKKIATDTFIENSIMHSKGMRLTLNDPWETLVVFIISQASNIKKIRMDTKNLMHMLGNGNMPDAEALKKADISTLRRAGLGFRAEYIKNAAEYCSENVDLIRMRGKDYYYIKEALMEMKGVGEKVADCVILMGFGNTMAFPVDRWIKRAMEAEYFNGEKKSIDAIHDFAYDKWKGLAGYAQQYIFRYARQR